jgi:uncharacterized membrane protein YkvA (DUF1232 family)
MDRQPQSECTLPALPIDEKRYARDEQTVEQGFWRKLRRTIGRIPFTEDAAAAYFCAVDPATPRYVGAILLAALAYFVVPADVIPDMIVGLGFSDDASVLLAAITAIGGHLKPQHRRRARDFLERGQAA